jgi:GTPase
MSETRCGYAAIVGRPNVGKSTLLNHLIQQKISITSRKPQTTRQNVTGVKTQGDVQIIFVDTPGMHRKQTKAINRYMNRVATSATLDVDVVLFVVDRTVWTTDDDNVVERLQQTKVPIILVVNKMDCQEDKTALIPHLAQLQERLNPAEIIPVSALRGHNLDRLEEQIVKRLPLGIHLFPEDQITDKSSRFLAAELIREKITRQLGAELPYQIAVEIDQFIDEKTLITIAATILVERDGQKRILIGEGGGRLKSIGTAARQDMETLFDAKVMLKLWVKIKAGWSDDDRALRSLGFHD